MYSVLMQLVYFKLSIMKLHWMISELSEHAGTP